jgi:hypothetical protein
MSNPAVNRLLNPCIADLARLFSLDFPAAIPYTSTLFRCSFGAEEGTPWDSGTGLPLSSGTNAVKSLCAANEGAASERIRESEDLPERL